MRLQLLLFICCLSIGGAASIKTVAQSNHLNGIWKPVRQELGGRLIPVTDFEKHRLTITDSLYTYVTYNTDRGITTYGDGKMDIYSKEGINAGRHFTAIYKLEKNQLTICYNMSGEAYPETFDTKGNPAFFLSVFRKESTK